MTQQSAGQREIAQAIASRKSFCKVLLKTADDPILLPIWLKHHLAMFRPEQIVIADNFSTDRQVLAIYNDLPPGLVVFGYAGSAAGFHNNIHDRAQFKWLYDALKASCEYLLLLDTDELLCVSSNLRRWSADGAELESMLRAAQGKAVSTTWVHTAPASTNTFYVGPDAQRLAWDLRWGKPFVPTAFDAPGVRIHNTQFPLELFDRQIGAGLYLLHLISFSREQRLRVNKRKLVARSVATEQESLDDILSRDYADHWDPTVRRLVEEIAQLKGATAPAEPDERLDPALVRFAPGGTVVYGGNAAEKAMSDFRESFSALFEQAMQA